MAQWIGPIGLLGTAVFLVTTGCGSDCDDGTRLDGEWSVSARVVSDTWQITGFDTENADSETATGERLEQAELLNQLPVNGTRTWTLNRNGESDEYTLRIDGQEYTARLIPESTSCNLFDASFAGSWDGPDGSVHNFKFAGQLTFLGDAITGEWKYSDGFLWEERGRSGKIAIPAGVFDGARGTADTASTGR